MNGELLALPRGSCTDFPISTDPNIRRHLTNGYAQSARLLKFGRVDAIAGTELSIYHYLLTMDLSSNDVGSILTFDSKPLWLQCAGQNMPEEFIMRLRQATNSLRKEGVFQELLKSYIPPGFR